jgi:hypothetical protein
MVFRFMLKFEDGSAAEPPTFATAVPNWKPGDVIPLGRVACCARSRSDPGRSQTATPS